MEWLIVIGGIGFLYLLISGINKCVTSLRNIEHLLRLMHEQGERTSTSISSDISKIAEDVRDVRRTAADYSSIYLTQRSTIDEF